MIFERVEYRGRALLIEPLLTLTPLLDEESKQLFVATDESLGLHVYAPTRDQLVDEVAEQLMFLWDTFGCGSSERLTEDARQLRTRLRARINEAD